MVQASTRTNPFPGLRPFSEQEDYLFFGREGQADELLKRLNEKRFLAIVGTSGSGKSSLVRAGLLPSLYSGFLTGSGSGWRVAIMRPGSAPIRQLAEALNHPEVFGVEPASDEAVIRTALTESTLRRGARGLVEVTEQARMTAYENLLVVVDQFEELFRFKQQARSLAASLDAEDEASAFVKLLLAAVKQRQTPVFVVLTMRSDFLGDCAQFRDLPEALNESQYLIPRLTREQLRRAIEGPVAVGGAEISPRLVNRLLNDVGDDPDQLPILQHALMRTWRRWVRDHSPNEQLDLRHYEAIGGMKQALDKHADEIYQTLDEQSQQVTEKLFQCLTEKGPDNREIRRPASLAEVCAVAGATPAEVCTVVEAFRATGRSFLMPPVGDDLTEASTLDISHESLMWVWQRLKNWVDEEARSAQIYRRLAETAALHAKGEAGYLQDPELSMGLTWRRLAEPNQVWAERYAPEFEQVMQFLDASAAAREAEVEAKEKARRREINRLRSFIGGLVLLSGLALGTAGYAYFQQQEALEQQQSAEAAQKREEVQRQLAEDRGNDLASALQDAEAARQEADDKRAEAEAAQATAEKAKTAEATQRQRAEKALGRAEAREAEAQRQAVIAQNQTIIAEENATQARSATAQAEREKQRAEIQALNSEIQAEALTIENLMASDLNFKALLSALKLGQQLKQWKLQPAQATTQMVAAAKAQGKQSRPSQRLATASHPASPISRSRRMQAVSVLREVYYLPGYLEHNTLEGHSGPVLSVSFSPDGDTLASASSDGTVKLWEVSSGRELQTLEGHRRQVLSVSFSPDGDTLASANDDGTIILWNFDLDDLIAKSCDFLSSYLAGPVASDDERALCPNVVSSRASPGALGWLWTNIADNLGF